MSAVRIEEDALGEVEIPDTALWGIQTARAVANLSFSGRTLGSCPAYVRALGLVKRAAARANRDAGVLEARLAEAIETATGPLIAGGLPDQFPVDLLGGGGSIGVNMNVNEVIANLANERLGEARGAYEPVHPLAHVNASQSTADVCHTAVRLAILERAALLDGALRTAEQTLADQATAVAGMPTLARTCLRDGVPTTVDVLLGGHAALLARRATAVRQALAPLAAVSLGGTVIGTGAGAPAAYRAAVVPLLAEVCERALTARAAGPDALQNSDDVAAALGAARAARPGAAQDRPGSAPARLRSAGWLRRAAAAHRAGRVELCSPARPTRWCPRPSSSAPSRCSAATAPCRRRSSTPSCTSTSSTASRRPTCSMRSTCWPAR